MSRIIYIASETGVSYGHVSDYTQLQGHAATLLARPGIDRETLARCIGQLAIFIVHDEDRSARSGGSHAALAAADHGGVIAISWNGKNGEMGDLAAIAGTKRSGPFFYGFPGQVAFIVDADWSAGEADFALGRLHEYALAPDSDFLVPLPVERVEHPPLGPTAGYTHDGLPVRG